MGEYITVSGLGTLKLGTLESLYYVRFSDLVRVLQNANCR